MSTHRTPGEVPTPRPAARVVLVDETDRALLFMWEALDVWITPGGGLLPGETYEEAALRELREETGLAAPEPGPWVWSRNHVFRWNGRLYDARERFYFLRVPHFQVSSEGMDAVELAEASLCRWWSVDEIAASRDAFAPGRIAELLPPLLKGEIPKTPIDTGA